MLALCTASCTCPAKTGGTGSDTGPTPTPTPTTPTPTPTTPTTPPPTTTTPTAPPPTTPTPTTPTTKPTPPPPTTTKPPPPPPTPDAQAGAAQGEQCIQGVCAQGLSCVEYYGIAGPRGPKFTSCEIPCADKTAKCPAGQKCVTIADGPGLVCRPATP